MCVVFFWLSAVVSAESHTVHPPLWFPLVQNAIAPGNYLSLQQKPLPTNAWFTNLFLKDKQSTWSQPVNLFPYLARIGSRGINISHAPPSLYAEPSNPDIVSALYYSFADTLVLGAVESLSDWKITPLEGGDIHVDWQNKLSSPMLRGSPYITLFYQQLTPEFFSRFQVESVNGSSQHGVLAAGGRIEIVLKPDAHNLQRWMLYSEHPIQFEWVTRQDGEHLQALRPYSGWLRLVLQKDSASKVDNDVEVLDTYSKTIPLDRYESLQTQDGRIICIWKWQTQNKETPLILSLPHHRPLAASKAVNVRYQSIKGELQGEVLATWEMSLPRPTMDFLEPRHIGTQEKEALKSALREETAALMAYPFPDDGPYRMGKRFARAARLALIAHAIDERMLKNQLLGAIDAALRPLMMKKARWHFQYDTTWGGIIPDVDDYGARHYNDHHFHYGYWVYTFAVMGHLRPSWLKTPVTSGGPSPREWIRALIRDYANSNPTDALFPVRRHVDDYAGHSWASGLTVSEHGQNQQSVSEAVNAYYALTLYAKVTKDKPLETWGQFLTARERLAAQTYWQVLTENSVYPKAFRRHNHVVATLWDSKVDANAFFKPCALVYRCGLEYAYGIQMLPFTAITTELLNPLWLQQAKPELLQLLNNTFGSINRDWYWIIVKGLAPVMTNTEKNRYFQMVIDSKIDEYDNGDSKTNTLYFLLPQERNLAH